MVCSLRAWLAAYASYQYLYASSGEPGAGARLFKYLTAEAYGVVYGFHHERRRLASTCNIGTFDLRGLLRGRRGSGVQHYWFSLSRALRRWQCVLSGSRAKPRCTVLRAAAVSSKCTWSQANLERSSSVQFIVARGTKLKATDVPTHRGPITLGTTLGFAQNPYRFAICTSPRVLNSTKLPPGGVQCCQSAKVGQIGTREDYG